MPKRPRVRARTKGEEIIGLVGGYIGGYIGAEILLARFMHPLHWLVAAVAAAVGYGGTLIWYKRRAARPRR